MADGRARIRDDGPGARWTGSHVVTALGCGGSCRAAALHTSRHRNAVTVTVLLTIIKLSGLTIINNNNYELQAALRSLDYPK